MIGFFYNTLFMLSLAVYYASAVCWDTGCQPDSWAVKGCAQYDMIEKKRTPCQDGNIYSCCDMTNSIDSSHQLEKAGDLTYYKLGLTACGQVYTDSDMVAALAFSHFTTPNPNLDPICGKRVKIVDPTTSKSVIVSIVDKCLACKVNDIDVSPAAFKMIKPLTVGRTKVVWDFI